MSAKTIRQPVKSYSPIVGFLSSVGQVTRKSLLAMTLLSSAAVAGSLVGLAISFRNLPDVRLLRNYVPNQTTYVYDINGKALASFHGEANREVVPLNSISPNLKRAVMAIEDSYFYYHVGINPGGIARALLVNTLQGETREGGSTVTMQLVKNVFLSPRRTISRKIAEAVLAMRIEQVFPKDKILEMYLNQVYWGHNNYGIQTAAKSYFNKTADKLTLGESAMLAGIVQAPEDFSPFRDKKVAKKRQAIVLNRMLELNWITEKEKADALKQTLKYGTITAFQASKAPYVTDTLNQELKQKLDKKVIARGGLRIQVTVDSQLQKIAEQTVQDRYPGISYFADQMALVAVDPRTHFIKAVVGGVDYKKSQYNRATQAFRQPGSSFKPFVYYTAFAMGKYTPDSTVLDTPVTYREGAEVYSPQNYDNTFGGAMSVRSALAVSRNIPAIRLGQEVGLENVIKVCRTLGITSPIIPVISLPLGSIEVTPLEMASAFATFANTGWRSPTTIIAQVTDSAGNTLIDNTPQPKLVLDPWAAASLNSAMQSVINGGTGNNAAIGRPAGGKTGTTSSERDIWFVGYVPQLSAAVWVGNDDNSPLGKGVTGGTVVAPIWGDFMYRALKNSPVEYFRSASEFPEPR